MAIAFVGLVLLLIYYMIRSYINKYSWYFCGIITSLILAIYSIFFLLVIKGNYIAFGPIDRWIFSFLVANRLGYFTAIRMFNLSQVLYIISLTLFSNSFFIQPQAKKIHI